MYDPLRDSCSLTLRKLCLLVVPLLILVLVGFLPAPVQSAENAASHERLVITTTGDTFSLISLREFGTTAFARLIAEYNRLPYSRALTVGQVLRIPVSPSVAVESANVVFAKGESVVRVRGNQQDLREIISGDKIYVHDVIKTAESGFVSLRFPSGTLVNIQPGSRVKLVSLDCLESRESCVISLDADAGSISTNVIQRVGQPTQFNVRTPHASAAVRGTIFDIDASAEQMLIGVTDGNVDVTALGQSTDLFRGLGLKTLAGQPSEPPIQLLPSPNFRRIPPRLTEQDTMGWFAMENADHYSLALLGDSEGSTVLYNEITTDLVHTMRSLPAGDYFVQLRAVDADGFKGFQSQLPLVINDLDTDAFVPTLSPTLDNGEVWLSVPDIPDTFSEYEIQLSFRQDFLEVSSVDVPVDGGILVAPADVVTYFRARSIINASTVGVFGPVLSVPPQ